MDRRSQNVWLAGVDGCRTGWIAAFIRSDGKGAHIRDVFENFSALFEGPDVPAVIAVDIPIGLPEHSFGGRAPDNAVRKLLAKGGSSVFPMPSRRAAFAEVGPFANSEARRIAHQRACAIAAATSTPSKRITIFTFGILPKIFQVDRTLQNNPSFKTRVFETHPEAAFAELNGSVLPDPKKNEAGKRLRSQLLISAGLPPAIVNSEPPKGAKKDDLLDALVCLHVARRIHTDAAKRFPDKPEIDQHLGLPMAIWV